MAAKDIYKIPVSLDRTILDQELTLSKNGFTLPIKVLLVWVCSILGLYWIVQNTFIKDSGIFYITSFSILWLVGTAFLGKYNKTKELSFRKVIVFFNYISKQSRLVFTRRTSNPSAFFTIADITSIDKDGLITWSDGTVGQAYRVVGSASILVFEDDKTAILNRVDAFYRKIDSLVEFVQITTKEPQQVYSQLAHLDDMNLALEDRDPELLFLMKEQFSILRDYVGSKFMSIHQYMVIKADNLEALRRAHNIFVAEAEESSLMLKQVSMLNKIDTEAMLHSLYGSSL